MAAGGVVEGLVKGTHNALSGFRQAGSKVDLEVTAKRPAGAAGCTVARKEGAEATCCGSRNSGGRSHRAEEGWREATPDG